MRSTWPTSGAAAGATCPRHLIYGRFSASHALGSVFTMSHTPRVGAGVTNEEIKKHENV